MEQLEMTMQISEPKINKFADFLLEKEHAEATIKKYVTDVKTFLVFLKGNRNINKEVLLQYKEWLIENYARMSSRMQRYLLIFRIPQSKMKKRKNWHNLQKYIK